MKFLVGAFDPEDANPFSMIGPDAIGSDAHLDLAVRAAEESMILGLNSLCQV